MLHAINASIEPPGVQKMNNCSIPGLSCNPLLLKAYPIKPCIKTKQRYTINGHILYRENGLYAVNRCFYACGMGYAVYDGNCIEQRERGNKMNSTMTKAIISGLFIGSFLNGLIGMLIILL